MVTKRGVVRSARRKYSFCLRHKLHEEVGCGIPILSNCDLSHKPDEEEGVWHSTTD